MGRIAERVGVRWTIAFGAVMVGRRPGRICGRRVGGDLIATGSSSGLLGNAGINAPLYIYISRWFDRRSGTALALIASGHAHGCGLIWPITIRAHGREFRLAPDDAAVCRCTGDVVVPVALSCFGPAPETATSRPDDRSDIRRRGAWMAAADRADPAVRRGLPVLRADGDAAIASGGVLQRCRHPGVSGAAIAVAAARLRLYQAGSNGGAVADRIGGIRRSSLARCAS